jgi:hypothetical protein
MWVDGCTQRREGHDRLLLQPFSPPRPLGLYQFRIDSGSTNLIDEKVEHFGQRLAHPRPSSIEETTVENHKNCHMNAC